MCVCVCVCVCVRARARAIRVSSQVTSSPTSRGRLWGSRLSWQIFFLALRASRRLKWSCVWSVAGLCVVIRTGCVRGRDGCEFAECHHAPAHKTVPRGHGKCVSGVDLPPHGVTRSQNEKASGNTAATASAKGANTGKQVVGVGGGGYGADGGSSPRETLEQVGMEEEQQAGARAAETKGLHLMRRIARGSEVGAL